MNPNIYKLGGHEINDGSTYEAWFVGDIFFRQAQGSVKLTKRADNVPVFTSKERNAKTFKIQIVSRSSSTDFSAAYTELNKWFDTFAEEELVLIVKDPTDSNRQWYVNVAVEDTPKVTPDGYFLDLVAADPIWRTVALNQPADWNMTASGQTNNFTIRGNRPARPIIYLTPTSAKSGGYASRMFRAWYNPLDVPYDNIPLDITNDAWNTTGLVADSSVSNQINQVGGITAVATSIPVDTSVGGGLPTTGGVCYADSEQIKYDSIIAGTMNVSTNGRGWGGTTAATHADNAVMKKSHMLANGADVQVYDRKRRISRWVSGANTTTTQVWIAADFQPALEMTLYESIASSGAVSTIKIQPTAEGIAALGELQKKGTFTFMIGSEMFSGTGTDPISLEITGVTRAIFSSSEAAHAVGDTIRWLEHEFWVCWGDLNVAATDDDLITQDETHKPMIDMDNSTNASWKYTEFFDDDGLRAGAWKRGPIEGRNCSIVGGSHGEDADPATEIGLFGRVYEVGGSPRANTYKLHSHLYHPAGFTSITCNGAKYRAAAGFAKVAGLWVGNDLNLGMASLFNESAPASAATWTSWSRSSVAIGTKVYAQWRLEGNVSATEDNYHALEVQTITSLDIGSTNRLKLAFSGSAQNVYEFGRDSNNKPLKIINNENDETLEILFLGELNETLKIDCNTERISYMKDNTRADYAVSYPPRDHMFELIPGDDGVNNVQIVDIGLAGMTVTFEWEDRNS